MIGAIINDRYHLNAELGQGGMGMVYLAHDSVLERDPKGMVHIHEPGYGGLGTVG